MDLATPIQPEDHILGPTSSQTIFVLYGDYTDPASKAVYDLIQHIFAEEADGLTCIYRHFPNTSNPHALEAARGAEAAALQGKFWEMHDFLFANQDKISRNTMREGAEKIGLDLKKFEQDILSDEIFKRIDNDIESGKKSSVYETPTLFINNILYDKQIDLPTLLTIVKNNIFASDLIDNPVIDTDTNEAVDFKRDEPIAYSLDPMPLEDEGYSEDETGTLYKNLKPDMTLDQYEGSALDPVEDQDHSDPEPS